MTMTMATTKVTAMTDAQPTADQQFEQIPKLDRRRIGAHVVMMEPRRYIEINDYGLRITVADARALRDWLNKVIPNE